MTITPGTGGGDTSGDATTVSPTTSVSSTSSYSSISGASPGGMTTMCLMTPSTSASSTAGAGGSGSTAASTSSASTSSTGGAPQCPSPQDAYNQFPHYSCGVTAVLSEGMYEAGKGCCYTVETGPCSGRPFLVGGCALTAPLVDGERGWGRASIAGFEPIVETMCAEARAIAAEAWARDGALEHASIASFGRFALELLAVGAPAELVADAHRAAVDEVRHAQLCFELASSYAGARRSPGAFPFGGAVEVETDLARIAARAVREGCVGETLAATLAAEQLAHATDPTVRRVLAAIAEDEAGHAELAWRFVAWAIRKGGATVRTAVALAFDSALMANDAIGDDVTGYEPELRAHGRLSRAELAAAAKSTRYEVILPNAVALLRGEEKTHEAGLDADEGSTVDRL